MAKKDKELKSVGINTYVDDRGRNIVYDWYFKKAYYITKNDEQQYRLYGMRFPLAIIVGFLLISNVNVYLGLGVGVAIFVIGEILYHAIFLNRLNEVPRFKKPDNGPFHVQLAHRMNAKRLILSIIATSLLMILLVINAQVNGYEGMLLYLNYAFAIASFVFGYFHLLALIYQKKNNIEVK